MNQIVCNQDHRCFNMTTDEDVLWQLNINKMFGCMATTAFDGAVTISLSHVVKFIFTVIHLKAIFLSL